MKANELMIGDWVLYNETPQQILEISGIDDEVYLETDELVHQSEIQPIPLTAEILEKNGWVEDGYFYRHKELGYIQLGKLFEHASFDFTKYGINYRIQTSPRYMKYIHQFQHALRLCGITREIII